MKKYRILVSFIRLLSVFFLLGVLAFLMVPPFVRATSSSGCTSCKSNLKIIGTALEMYSVDWEGKYPRNLLQVTPNYLKDIPECHFAGANSYCYIQGPGHPLNIGDFEDFYSIYCAGSSHRQHGLPDGYPQYDGIQGLIER